MFHHAIVRTPSLRFADGLTTAALGVPDVPRALQQHEGYCAALESCGVKLTRLPAEDAFPDSTFVEDVALLFPECAVLTRPGAPSRAGESALMRPALERFRTVIHTLQEPATLDGGDVCVVGTRVFVGLSLRTNEEGAQQLQAVVRPLGYGVVTINIRALPALLHLKSGMVALDHKTLLAVPELVVRPELQEFDVIKVPPAEAYAANCVAVGESVLVPEGFPELAAALVDRRYRVLPVPMSEFQKMDGGLSCLSLRFS